MPLARRKKCEVCDLNTLGVLTKGPRVCNACLDIVKDLPELSEPELEKLVDLLWNTGSLPQGFIVDNVFILQEQLSEHGYDIF
jgi:hypothetical protein